MIPKQINYCVYIHTFPNNKRYIGITSQDVSKRWCNGLNYKKTHQIRMYNAINKYKWKNIKHEILFSNLTKEQAEEKEIELIKQYKTTNHKYGYNISNGGNGNGKHSESTKTKISNSLKGHVSANKGKPMSEEQKLKLSNKRKGFKFSEDSKLKMSESRKGIKMSEATKLKISLSNKGKHFRKPSEETKLKMSSNRPKTKVYQYDLNNIFIKEWDSITSVKKELGIHVSNIIFVCKGKRKTTGGYIWTY